MQGLSISIQGSTGVICHSHHLHQYCCHHHQYHHLHLHCCLTAMLNMTQRGTGVRWWRDVPRGNAPTRKGQRLRSWQMSSCWRNEEEKPRSCGKFENTSCIVRKWSRKGKRRGRRKSRRRCWICDETPNLTFSTLLETVKKMVKPRQQQNFFGTLCSQCTGGVFEFDK